MDQIKELVKGVRFLEKVLSNPTDKHNADKFDQLKKMFGKSLAVNKDLVSGHIIQASDLESKKPAGEGYSTANYLDLINKKLNKNLSKYSFINSTDF